MYKIYCTLDRIENKLNIQQNVEYRGGRSENGILSSVCDRISAIESSLQNYRSVAKISSVELDYHKQMSPIKAMVYTYEVRLSLNTSKNTLEKFETELKERFSQLKGKELEGTDVELITSTVDNTIEKILKVKFVVKEDEDSKNEEEDSKNEELVTLFQNFIMNKLT